MWFGRFADCERDDWVWVFCEKIEHFIMGEVLNVNAIDGHHHIVIFESYFVSWPTWVGGKTLRYSH